MTDDELRKEVERLRAQLPERDRRLAEAREALDDLDKASGSASRGTFGAWTRLDRALAEPGEKSDG